MSCERAAVHEPLDVLLRRLQSALEPGRQSVRRVARSADTHVRRVLRCEGGQSMIDHTDPRWIRIAAGVLLVVFWGSIALAVRSCFA